ncbi:MAG: YIP1 family protein [Bacteroidota bacterium]|nr:YIP1 family protein [Bacteroidota bacterium]
MENQQINPVEAPEVSSFTDRMVDIFSAPAKLFTEVASTSVQNLSWAIPYIIAMCLALITTITILSDQTLRSQALEPQRDAMQERVDRGEMRQEQMDAATEMMESGSMIVITGSIAALVMTTIAMFGVPLIFWITVKLFFKSQAGYKKLLEVYGLSMLIGILGAIVTVLMIFLFNSILASPSGSLLLVDSFDYKNMSHKFLASINFFTIWQMAVFGIGVAKISNKSINTGIGITIGLWLAWVIITLLLGWGMR